MGHHQELTRRLAAEARSVAQAGEDRLGHIARPRLKKEVEGRSHSQSPALLLRRMDCLWKMRTNDAGYCCQQLQQTAHRAPRHAGGLWSWRGLVSTAL